MVIKVIAIVGMSGTGKSTVVDYLTERGYPKVYFGGVIVDEARRRFGPSASQAQERLVREELRAQEGKGAVAARIIPKIEALLKTHEVVVADGLYSWSEYRIFKEKYGNQAVVIAITSSRQTRHQRLSTRPERPLTPEEANTRDYAEVEFLEKGGPIANADYTICNDGTPDELFTKFSALLQQLDLA